MIFKKYLPLVVPVLAALIFNLFYNWPVVFRLPFFCTLASTLFFAVILTRNRWIFALSYPLLLIPSALASYFCSRYGVPISANITAAMMETTAEEAQEFITVELILWVLLAGLLAAAIVAANFYVKKRWPLRRNPYHEVFLFCAAVSVFLLQMDVPEEMARFGVITLFAGALSYIAFKQLNWRLKAEWIPGVLKFVGLLSLFILSISTTSQQRKALPLNAVHQVKRYYESMARINEAIASRKDLAKRRSSFDEKRGESLKVVLIIGESARGDHFSLNGYDRETNPLLAQRTNLISFKKAKARSAATRIAVPNILTRAKTSRAKKLGRETSFISLFKKHDFHTVWLSMNAVFGTHNITVSTYAQNADTVYFKRNYEAEYERQKDGFLLPPYRGFLEKHKNEKQLLMLHTQGSHWRFDLRYPPQFEIFKPAGKLSSSAARNDPATLINCYDNTILFTDYFINEVITPLEDEKALVIYVSDHGESLGEDGVHGHSQDDRPEQRHIPLIVWGSEKYVAQYPDEFRNLERHAEKKVSHDHIFHSILGCTGFSSAVIDHSLNLCR